MLPLVCLYGIEVIMLDCIDDAGRHVFLEDHAADGLDSRFDSRKLDQHFRAVTAVFYHSLCRFHMTDNAAHSVEYRFGMLR